MFCVKLGDSWSNGSRDIQLPHFVMDEWWTNPVVLGGKTYGKWLIDMPSAIGTAIVIASFTLWQNAARAAFCLIKTVDELLFYSIPCLQLDERSVHAAIPKSHCTVYLYYFVVLRICVRLSASNADVLLNTLTLPRHSLLVENHGYLALPSAVVWIDCFLFAERGCSECDNQEWYELWTGTWWEHFSNL